MTGLEVARLRAEATKPASFVGVLDSLLANEDDRMDFAGAAGTEPAEIQRVLGSAGSSSRELRQRDLSLQMLRRTDIEHFGGDGVIEQAKITVGGLLPTAATLTGFTLTVGVYKTNSTTDPIPQIPPFEVSAPDLSHIAYVQFPTGTFASKTTSLEFSDGMLKTFSVDSLSPASPTSACTSRPWPRAASPKPNSSTARGAWAGPRGCSDVCQADRKMMELAST